MKTPLLLSACRRTTVTLAIAALCAPLAATAAEPVKIGALMPLTGGLQAYGESCLNGVRMAVNEANAAGGLLGGKVQIIIADTQTKSQPSIDAAKKLTSISAVSGMVGALSSGNTIPVAQSVSSVDRVPTISPASTAPTITRLNDGDFLFRTVPSDAFQGVALAQVSRQEGKSRVAILYINNDYGEGLAESFTAAFESAGGNVTASEPFEPGKASYRGELSSAADSGAEDLLLIAYPDDGGITILKQALEEGLFQKFILTDGMKAEDVVDQIGANHLNGTFGTAPKALETDTSRIFQANYEEAFGELPPRPFIDSSYDAAMVLLLAIAKAGSRDGEDVRDALRDVTNAPGIKIKPGEFAKALRAISDGEDINYVGASGDHEFDADGDVSGTFEHWVVNNGQLETVTVFAPN